MFRSALLALACAALVAQAPDPFGPVKFLAGEWVGEGSGEPGKGSGEFSFRFELEGKALVRRSWAAYPAQDGRPATRHEDLMTVYPESGQLKALYVDNEGHVIHYTATALDKGEGVVFQSDPQPGPAFRLTYRLKGAEAVNVAFAIAPPAQPAVFTTYVEGVSLRKHPQPLQR